MSNENSTTNSPLKKSKSSTKYVYFGLILYLDNSKHLALLNYVKNNGFDYVYICHDRDMYETDIFDDNGIQIHKSGELKKAHIHLIYKTDKSTITGQLKFWGGFIDKSKIEGINNIHGYYRYLLHTDFASMQNTYKYRYTQSDLIGTIKFDNNNQYSENLLVSFIYQNVCSGKNITFSDLCLYAVEIGQLSDLKRSAYFYRNLINDLMK